jgi:hypothetical protein
MEQMNQEESRYRELCKRDGTDEKDIERKTLFWILSHNADLYAKRNHIYDFKERGIKPECFDSPDVDFSGGSRALVRLAFNLYNGYKDEHTDVLSILQILDHGNYILAFDAINMRMRKYSNC